MRMRGRLPARRAMNSFSSNGTLAPRSQTHHPPGIRAAAGLLRAPPVARPDLRRFAWPPPREHDGYFGSACGFREVRPAEAQPQGVAGILYRVQHAAELLSGPGRLPTVVGLRDQHRSLASRSRL